jgi:hypothetical protein
MAKFIITHPVAGCNTVFHGLRFVDGKAELDTSNSSLLSEFPGMDENEIVSVFQNDGCKVTSVTEEIEVPAQVEETPADEENQEEG